MKNKILIGMLFLFVCVLSACSAPAGGMSEEEQVAAAQQTLDALNAAQSQPATEAPPTPIPATSTAPAANGFEGAVGTWQLQDIGDSSISTLRISASGDGRFSFEFIDPEASVCGLDGNGSPQYSFIAQGAAVPVGNTLSIPSVPGTCSVTNEVFTLDWVFTYDTNQDILFDTFSYEWTRTDGNPDTSSGGDDGASSEGLEESVSDTFYIELDDAGPIWDNDCNTVIQQMDFFSSDWREDDQIFGGGFNCDLAFDLQITQSGTYEIFLVATYAPDFGILDMNLRHGAQDDFIYSIALFDPDVRPTEELPIGQWYLSTDDENLLALQVIGKQDASSDFNFGLDYIKLILISPDF